MYVCMYVLSIYICIYIYMYIMCVSMVNMRKHVSRGSYLVQNTIDGVFLPRYTVNYRFFWYDLVLQ